MSATFCTPSCAHGECEGSREFASVMLRRAAEWFDSYHQRVEVALGGQRYVADALRRLADNPSELDPCDCPDSHCGDCGCCPDEWGPR